MLNSKLIGGILFILGTSIGGGMLVLPVSIAAVGLMTAIFFLIACWLIMTCGALLLLEVTLQSPAGSNLLSMAKKTLGLPAQVIAWIAYLVLLYTLLSAYISGGTDVLQNGLTYIHLVWPSQIMACLFTLILGFIVYQGMRVVDYVNRLFMFGKLSIYALLVIIIAPYINPQHLHGGSFMAITGSLMLFVTSFGFATIVPSLCDYFEKDASTLRKAIIWGSLIPLICYLIWIIAIMGVIPRTGQHGLLNLNHAPHMINGFINTLNTTVHRSWIDGLFAIFTSICMITAFLGVSLGLFDFFADGLSMKKTGVSGGILFLFTFLPPLTIVLFFPGLYLQAFNYAGVCCVILALFLPVLMAWQARKNQSASYLRMLPAGNILLTLLGVIAFALLVVAAYTMGWW